VTATSRIAIPELLSEGRWSHAFIATYNADLRFYEADVWPRISARNCMVLVDDEQLLDAFTQAGRLRHAGVRYVVEPIRGSTSAHAKLVWLSSREEGLLLVGSGNLTTNGYTRDGELFTAYRFSAEQGDQLATFQAARSFLDALVEREHLPGHVKPHLNRAWHDSPWLHTLASTESRLRHNLDVPLIEQLVTKIGDRPVRELVVHAPFYDKRCEALGAVITRLQPRHVEVLVQAGETSVDPAALRRTLDRAARSWTVRRAAGPNAGTYLHAKFILARLHRRQVCLQGSANLSPAALTRTPPHGNIELANLLEGPAGAYDTLVNALETENADPADLQVSFREDETAEDDADQVRLLSGTLQGATLDLELSHPPAEGRSLRLLVQDELPTGVTITHDSRHVAATLPAPLADWLRGRVRPVALRIADGPGSYDTNPIYPSQPEELSKLLTGQHEPETLRRIGQIDLDIDQDVSSVLAELADTLPFDRRALWCTVRPASSEPAADGPRLGWEELDWEQLRRHPVLAQYRTMASRHLEPTDLQLLLRATASGLPTQSEGATPEGISEDPDSDTEPSSEPGDDDDLLTDAEISAREAERSRRHHTIRQRNQRAWRSFLKRLVAGLEDPEFVQVIGLIAATTNAALANKLMTLLVARGHLEVEDVLLLQLRLWERLWTTDGLLANAAEEEQELAANVRADLAAVEYTLGGIYLAEQAPGSLDVRDRLHLRDRLRSLLGSSEAAEIRALVSEAAALMDRGVEQVAGALIDLAWETHDDEPLAAVADALGIPEHDLRWRPETIIVNGATRRIECLIVDRTVELDPKRGRKAMEAWLLVDPRRGHWRLQTPGASVAADAQSGDAWLRDRATKNITDLDGLVPVPSPPWASSMRDLKMLHLAFRTSRMAFGPPLHAVWV
jgi:hypothetical protein